MPAAFVVVPQWQGSGSSRAMRLVDGAEAIRGDLPTASTFSVNVPLEAGDELIARAKTAQAQAQVQESLKSIDLLDPTSEISRFEEKIRREEAKVLGQQELAASSLDAQFEQLEDLDKEAEIDARLASLKLGGAPKAVTE